MTLLPTTSWAVTAAEGPDYKVGPRCSNPSCTRWADHAHHIFRRSFIGGDVAWVRIEDVTVQNKCGLCVECHQRVTVNQARIAWHDTERVYVWEDVPYETNDRLLLDPQPAHLGAAGDSPAPDPHGNHGSAEVCPTCKRSTRKRAELPPGEKRSRTTWTAKVPDDAEDGAEVLDTLVDELAGRWGMGEFTSQLRRYHVLVPALYACIQNDITIEEG